MKTLFPISLNNLSFSTEKVVGALKPLMYEYEEIVFIIADQLQLYNRAVSAKDGNDVALVIQQFNSGKSLYEQRSIWLNRIKTNIGIESITKKWTVRGLDEIADHYYFSIYRNVLLLFYTCNEFNQDIKKDAENFLVNKIDINIDDYARRINLSVSYILEEIAASIRLHVNENIFNEHYLGTDLPTIINLYNGRYGIDVFSLAGKQTKKAEWTFYRFSESGIKKWMRQ
jgi:hypothetical protein